MTARSSAASALVAANAVLGVPVLYLGGLTVVALVASRARRQPTNGEVTTRFVVLVPAHDEETTISVMLRSVMEQDYPSSLFSVHVVADNCVDATASIVRSHGATAHERTDALHPGKGPALNWLVDRLSELEVPYDAAVYVDADTTVASDFLAVLDARFRSGSVAVQGFYGVRDAFDSTPAALRYCALAARHHCRPLARTAIGGSCGLFGNGMAFSRELNTERTWTSHLVEDMEFQVELLLSGVRVEYEPLARVEAEMPHSFAGSVTQHQRWESGRMDIVKRYVPTLLRRIVRSGPSSRRAAADSVIDLCVPPLSLLTAATAASAAVGVGLGLVTPRRSATNLVGVVYLAIIGAHVFVSLRLVRAPRQAYRALLHAPALAAWKVTVLFRSIGRTDDRWIRTQRNAESDAGGQ